MTIIRMPEIATGTGEAAVQTWLVDVGDAVTAGQPIAELETEKAVVELEAEVAGVFAGTLVEAGTSAEIGTPIAAIAVPGQSVDEALADSPEPAAPAAVATAAPAVVAAVPAAVAPARQFVTPLVRRLARERGVDLTGVVGSGPNGRIVRRDLERLPSASPAAPAEPPVAAEPTPAGPAPTAAAGFTQIPHTGMRRAIARRLVESTSTVPHFTLVADCRADALLALRTDLNADSQVKISVNDLILKAVGGALQEVPEANAIWTDDAIRRYDHADVAVAVALPTGLITPVVRGVDQLSISQLSSVVRGLVERARAGQLKQHEIEGGTFSVSNLGMHGVAEFSAIINRPHAGILAVGAARRRPVVEQDGSIAAATVLTITLSADHRVIDGALAATWLAALTRRIENPLRIIA